MPAKESITSTPLWYKDAVIYELHVKSFYDSNGDGIGDFPGLIQKLDYLKELGVTAIWLLPFYPSPQKDDGYDIQDYYDVHPDYGTLNDFRKLLREAHKRGMKVITELVINHTSDQHEWFQKSRQTKPGTQWHDYYVWSDNPDKYKEARVIFSDFEQSNWAWDKVKQSYYWHRFYSHQPDLNFENPQVQKQILKVLDFWLGMGVDGLRLDAVPYLYEQEGTNCENLKETHDFLKRLRAHIDKKYKNRMLLAEANQWPEDAAEYFGDGDECHMAFHFPVMPRLFMSVQLEDRFPIVNMIEQSQDIPETCQWTMFLRNHDELTLEMVTDEERDYMYRAFAKDPKARINVGIRRRLAPLLDNNRRKIELLNFLLLSLPGTPVIYYGDEVGMGDNYYLGDRNGVRTPMQWSPDRNAGFSKANPQQLFLPVVIDFQYHYTSVNVESQLSNVSSLLWFMRRLISTRNRFKALGRGSIDFIQTSNNHILCFVRKFEDEYILVVANLSRFCQIANIALTEYKGWMLEEVFGGNPFPVVDDRPYVLSLGPHNTYWFTMKKQKEAIDYKSKLPFVKTDRVWGEISRDGFYREINSVLPFYLQKCRWFGGKGKQIRSTSVIDNVPSTKEKQTCHLLLVEVAYRNGQSETYLLPVSFAAGQEALDVSRHYPQSIICEANLGGEEGVIYDSVYDPKFREDLLQIILDKRTIKSGQNKLTGSRTDNLEKSDEKLTSEVLKGEQSNTSILYGNKYFFKLYRRSQSGTNPDAEISKYLTEQTDFDKFPAFVGTLDWQHKNLEKYSIGLLLEKVPNESDAWIYTLDSVARFLTAATANKESLKDAIKPKVTNTISLDEITEPVVDLLGPLFMEMVSLLGKRTAQLHLALSTLKQDKEIAPEPFSLHYQKSIYQSMRLLTLEVFANLHSNMSELSEEVAGQSQEILSSKNDIIKRFRSLTSHKISSMKIRIHGDYHLGQVLYTGNDFIIIDFEGEPARPISHRRLKHSPLRDLAGMIRSFHYAAFGAVILRPVLQTAQPEELHSLADIWYSYVSAVFLNSYLETAGKADFLPANKKDFEMLMGAFLLEKSIYEIGYELNNRPDWVSIPLRGVQQLLKGRT